MERVNKTMRVCVREGRKEMGERERGRKREGERERETERGTVHLQL